MNLIRLLMLTSLMALAACSAPPAATATALPQPTPAAPAATSATASPPATLAEPAATAPPPSATAEPQPPAAPTEDQSYGQQAPASQPFVKMEVAVTGSALVDAAAGLVRFSDDFRVADGPDLFVVLSPADNLALDFISFSTTVTAAEILYLGDLASVSGAQEYAVPPGTDLAKFNTVVIWCRQYSVAFAAALLR